MEWGKRGWLGEVQLGWGKGRGGGGAKGGFW